MRNATLTFLVRDEYINLAEKLRGFGVNRHNGYGGKQHDGESIEEAAVRELFEESKVSAAVGDLTKLAEIEFTFPEKPEWNQLVHIYLLEKWVGEPAETEEMRPKWFQHHEIPYDQMWPADPLWIPHMLAGRYVEGRIVLGSDQNTVLDYDLTTHDGSGQVQRHAMRRGIA